ncbi:MAG: type II secretion system F family protein [Candidatus Schekmanbacteria bacterium]|nr:type II secretion system F family protein [Candidatus Schekmanbacteria bacterium]
MLFYLIIILTTCAATVLTTVGILELLRQLPQRQKKPEPEKPQTGTLEDIFLFITPRQYLYLRIGGTLLVMALAGLIGRNILLALFGGGFGYCLPRIILKMIRKRRTKKLELQLVDALITLSSSLKAGFTVVQAFDMIATEYQAPISQEIGLLLQEYRLGIALDEALLNLTCRVKSQDLDLVVNSTIIARSLGGNLAEMFDRLAETIRRRMKIEGKIKSLTAQGKMQGVVVGILPFILGGLISFVNPDLMKPMFTTPAGYAAIGAILVMETLGALVIRKIVKIDI